MLSVVTGYGQSTWPTTSTITYTQPERVPTQKEWEDFLELVDKAAKWDKLMGEADCIDHAKEKWMKDMKKFMKKMKKIAKEN